MILARSESRVGGWLSPLVYLTNNWISFVGVAVVTSATVLWLFLLPKTLHAEVENPYFGILAFLALPGAFFGGLSLIPLGIFLKVRRERRTGLYPTSFPVLDLRNANLRRLLVFMGAMTLINIAIGGQVSYKAVAYMDSVTFCGQTCHTVMQPEFAGYQNSPHSRVECVKCHIGPGASWFVRSKLSGVGQVYAVTFNTYSRPIPTPVHNLRPARETCEACHWPQQFGADRLRIIPKYADDQANTLTQTVLLMRIGPKQSGLGIHGAHLGPGVTIEYAHADEDRQTIPWVQYRDTYSGRSTLYLAPDTKPDAGSRLSRRLMDCMDCHNRPTHAFELPERAVDQAIAHGRIAPTLPFAKKTSVEILKRTYSSQSHAEPAVPTAFEKFYQSNHPEMYGKRRAEIHNAALAVLAIYQRNVFPEMRVTWGTYPNNIGHTDFPGCFRCHDEQHKSADGKVIGQDCNSCHRLLAMEESSPKILTDLGLAESDGTTKQ